jgi:hypothetical protein
MANDSIEMSRSQFLSIYRSSSSSSSSWISSLHHEVLWKDVSRKYCCEVDKKVVVLYLDDSVEYHVVVITSLCQFREVSTSLEDERRRLSSSVSISMPIRCLRSLLWVRAEYTTQQSRILLRYRW